MNVNRNLFFNYQRSFNFNHKVSESLIFKGNDLEVELKKILKSEEVFIDLKDLIINNPHLPIFVYAAELYKEYFWEIFKENDTTYSLQNAIACTLANDMIYLDTTDSTKIPDMKNDFYLVDDNGKTYINPQVSLKNKYLAMQYYNPTIAIKIFNSSVAYFNLYKNELDTLQKVKLDDIPTIFKNLQTYHSRKYILCNYLFDMTSDLKKNVESFFSVLDQIEVFLVENNLGEEFKEDIDHIRIAYNLRNK